VRSVETAKVGFQSLLSSVESVTRVVCLCKGKGGDTLDKFDKWLEKHWVLLHVVAISVLSVFALVVLLSLRGEHAECMFYILAYGALVIGCVALIQLLRYQKS